LILEKTMPTVCPQNSTVSAQNPRFAHGLPNSLFRPLPVLSSSFFIKNKEIEIESSEKRQKGQSTESQQAGKSDPRFAVGKAWKPWMTPSLQGIDFIENSERPTEWQKNPWAKPWG